LYDDDAAVTTTDPGSDQSTHQLDNAIAGTLAPTSSFWLLFVMVVPVLSEFLAERPTPTTRQVSSWGPPPQLLRHPGQRS